MTLTDTSFLNLTEAILKGYMSVKVHAAVPKIKSQYIFSKHCSVCIIDAVFVLQSHLF